MGGDARAHHVGHAVQRLRLLSGLAVLLLLLLLLLIVRHGAAASAAARQTN
jgi:hypothetical protein